MFERHSSISRAASCLRDFVVTFSRVIKRAVLTGGPGAGKTVVSRRLAAEHPDRFVLVPEAATQVYAALRTRWDRLDLAGRRDMQRRIYHLQVEQEDRLAREHPDKTLLLDRGTIDGAAYWPEGPAEYWRDLGTTIDAELARYDLVVWMQTCAVVGAYDGDASNTCRFEDADAAIASGNLLAELWSGHPRLVRIDAYPNVEDKVRAVAGALDVPAQTRSEPRSASGPAKSHDCRNI
jgi:predicted ATPase